MPTKVVKERGWKDLQSKSRLKKKTKLAVVVLAVIIGVLVLGWAVRLGQTLFSPWQGSSSSKNYSWESEFNINLLIKSKDIALFSYNPTDKKITVVKVPDETLLDVPYGFGKWQARAVYNLGEASDKGEGNKLLKDSLVVFFGLPIDGFIQFQSELGDKNSEEIVEFIRQNPLNVFGLMPNIKTDLTLWELVKLKLEVAEVRFDKVKYIDLVSLGLLDEDNLADGTKVYLPDPIKIDSISSQLTDPVLVSENKTIAVFNSTKQPQLAQTGARIIENLGGNVIITANSEELLEKSKVIGVKSQTLKRLSQIFNEGMEGESITSRADINVMLGEDFFESQNIK